MNFDLETSQKQGRAIDCTDEWRTAQHAERLCTSTSSSMTDTPLRAPPRARLWPKGCHCHVLISQYKHWHFCMPFC